MFKYLKYFLIFCSIFFLFSCVTPRAEFQSKTYSPQKKAVIKYSLASNLFQPEAVRQRRMDAEMKMESFCGDQKPFILSEQKEERQSGYYTNTSYHDQSDQRTNKYGAYGGQQSHFTKNVNRYGSYGRHGYQYGSKDKYGSYKGGYSSVGNKSGRRSGRSRTVSQPIIRTYNIISFECK